MIKEIDATKQKGYSGHEKVFYFADEKSGLEGYIAIHSTKPGSATGGTRVFPYKDKNDALTDVLLLSEAMTHKCTHANLPFGGGKATIICDPKDITEELLNSYAKIIHLLGGLYTTGTDVGLTENHTEYMSTITPYILHNKDEEGRGTSNMAALGVFESIKSAVDILLPEKKLNDLTITVKGLGKLGSSLVELLYGQDVKLIVADIDPSRVDYVKKRFPGVSVVDSELIHQIDSDVYSPCAMGGEFNVQKISELKSPIIVGGANNQLVSDGLADLMYEKGIWYIPDYIANAGGLIHVTDSLSQGGYNSDRVISHVKNIGDFVKNIIDLSINKKISPLRVVKSIENEKFQ